MEQLTAFIQGSEALQNLIANPGLALAVAIVAILLGKALKLAGKTFKVIVLVGIAYVLVNVIMSGVI